MITVELVLGIHRVLIRRYGGLVFQYFEDNIGDIEGFFKEAEVV